MFLVFAQGRICYIVMALNFYLYFVGSLVGFDNIYWAPTRVPGTVLDPGDIKMRHGSCPQRELTVACRQTGSAET